MVKKPYEWGNGAELGPHSKIKHKIYNDYFRDYLVTRCSYPARQFRLAVVDGFSGGGKYRCGSHGSPLIFITTLHETINEVNLKRAAENLPVIQVECLLILNDYHPDAIRELKENAAPYIAAIKDSEENIHLNTHYMNMPFEKAYPEILQLINDGKYGNVLFNLDQCGHSLVNLDIITHILTQRQSSEIFLTFAIKSFLTFLSTDIEKNRKSLDKYGITGGIEDLLEGDLVNKKEFLGVAENLVYQRMKSLAKYASPFSINNPDGWRYWLIHFANRPKARQVYNNILHDNATSQAHFGRSGLNMLDYNPEHEGGLYLFDTNAREQAKIELYDDIPRFIEAYGDAINVGQFYEEAYRETPAHSDDVDAMILENNDLEIVTPDGGTRRKKIKNDDTIKFKKQRSFFPLFTKTSGDENG